MKALEKDRTRRYESANELAKDVQRYLNDEAVQACPPSASYRFGKLARRNKAVLTTLAVVTTALIAGIIGTSWQAIRAEKNLELANTAQKRAEGNLKLATAEQRRAEGNLDLALEALDAVYLDAIGEEKLLGVPLAQPDDEEIRFVTPPPLTDLERELLERGLSFYDQFAQQNAVASRAFVQTAQAYYRVGLLQNAVGDLVAADDAYRAQSSVLRDWRRRNPITSNIFGDWGMHTVGFPTSCPNGTRQRNCWRMVVVPIRGPSN